MAISWERTDARLNAGGDVQKKKGTSWFDVPLNFDSQLVR